MKSNVSVSSTTPGNPCAKSPTSFPIAPPQISRCTGLLIKCQYSSSSPVLVSKTAAASSFMHATRKFLLAVLRALILVENPRYDSITSSVILCLALVFCTGVLALIFAASIYRSIQRGSDGNWCCSSLSSSGSCVTVGSISDSIIGRLDVGILRDLLALSLFAPSEMCTSSSIPNSPISSYATDSSSLLPAASISPGASSSSDVCSVNM